MTYRELSTERIGVTVRSKDGYFDIADVEMVEFIFNDARKVYPDDVEFDGEKFIVDLTQEDTMGNVGLLKCQCRVKYKNGAVKASNIVTDFSDAVLSREIL